jgi:hypothetical protein
MSTYKICALEIFILMAVLVEDLKSYLNFTTSEFKVIPQFCIAHFYCAHLITYNFIHYTYRLKQNIIL